MVMMKLHLLLRRVTIFPNVMYVYVCTVCYAVVTPRSQRNTESQGAYMAKCTTQHLQ